MDFGEWITICSDSMGSETWNYDRPTNRQTDMRAHKDVYLPITFEDNHKVVKFWKSCLLIKHNDNFIIIYRVNHGAHVFILITPAKTQFHFFSYWSKMTCGLCICNLRWLNRGVELGEGGSLKRGRGGFHQPPGTAFYKSH